MRQLAIREDTVKLVREAAEWRLIGLLFECPTDDWYEEVVKLAVEVNDQELAEAAESAQQEATPTLYHTTFGPGGPAPPREVSYRDLVHPGQFIAELRSMYDAFAYHPATTEPPDHIAVQAGFVGYLLLKQAYAESRGAPDEAAVVADAVRGFMSDHIATVAEPLGKSLECSGIRYLCLVAGALAARAGVTGNCPPS